MGVRKSPFVLQLLIKFTAGRMLHVYSKVVQCGGGGGGDDAGGVENGGGDLMVLRKGRWW